jgi:hypothetical protein
MCKEIEHKTPFYTKPKKQGPITGQLRVQTKRKIRSNPNEIAISSQNTTMAQVRKPKGARSPKMG